MIHTATQMNLENNTVRNKPWVNKWKSHARNGLPLLELLTSEVPGTQTIPMLMVSLQNSAVRSSAEDTTHLSHRTWRNKVGTDLGTSHPLTTFHNAGRRSSCYMLPGRKVITNPIYLWTLWATIITGQARHTHWCNSGTNITGIIKYFLTAFEFHSIRWNPYPGTTIRPRIYGLQVVGPLGKSTTIILSIGKSTKATPNDLDQCTSQHPPEKLLSAADGNEYEPILVKVQRLRDCWRLITKWDIYITFLPSSSQGSRHRREHKDCKSQRR